ncbi:MAG: hypothetical protein QNJ29_07270 [Rhizobiaceae bacterium]|nr:hypothetical protein [Rhizobiaceae bacterium]
MKSAAATGDTDYIYQYGKELEVQAFVNNDAAMMAEALRSYRQVFDAGDMRGSEMLGAARTIRDWNLSPSRTEMLGIPAMEWTLAAARSGRVAAMCRYGIGRLKKRIPIEWIEETSTQRPQPDIRPASKEEFIAFLEECARAKRIGFPPNPPFGDVALYARKRRGSSPGLANSPGWATTLLGKLYATGTLVEKDHALAMQYFQSRPKFGDAKDWIAALDSQSEQR